MKDKMKDSRQIKEQKTFDKIEAANKLEIVKLLQPLLNNFKDTYSGNIDISVSL